MNGDPDERHDDRDRDRRLELLRGPRPRSSAGPAFFGALFSWQFAASNVPGYFMIPNADPSAGLTTTDEDSGGHTYFTVPDIEAAATRVREFGGEAAAPLQVPSGTFARRRDDQGTEFSHWQELREVEARG